MAIPKMFNSGAPFVAVKGGSGMSLGGEESAMEGEEEEEKEEEKEEVLPLVQVGPRLSLAMEQGTAKHLGTAGEEDDPEHQGPYGSIIAQAQGEDSQEFSPTSTERVFPRSYLLRRSLAGRTLLMSDTEEEGEEEEELAASHRLLRRRLRRKHRRKPRRRRRELGEEPPVIQGLWVQEIDWSRPAAIATPPHAGGRGGGRGARAAAPVDPGAAGASHDRRRPTGPPPSLAPPGGRRRSDSSPSSPEEEDLGGVWESVCTHASASDSSRCGAGGVSLSVCSVGGVSDCLSGALCVSDNFLVRGGDVSSDDTCALMGVSASEEERESGDSASDAEDGVSDDDSSSSSSCGGGEATASDSETAAAPEEGERGRVTQSHRRFVSPFFRELLGDVANDDGHVNEGLVLLKELRPRKSRYREGKEYQVLHHIQNGSYGDVFCVQDSSTGFVCAAKKIPLGHFSGEELSTWSALDSPRVVQLFGAVREGLNVTLFMDLKPGCLAQLLRERGSLPEDLALHYHRQLLGALQHLHHRRVLHLDVKVDNVLLSEDGMDVFLCDFGLSETLDHNGQSNKAFRGPGFPGTETHMAPEVAGGDLRSAKADVWSCCCTLLHMLNGVHPWIRYYAHPLCLKIVNEPAPLWEVPPSCNHFTAELFRAGLQKDPRKRASATELRKKTTQALRAVGGLSSSSINGVKPLNLQTQNGDVPSRKSSTIPTMQWVSPWRAKAADEDSSDREEGESAWELRDSESGSDSMATGGRESQRDYNPGDTDLRKWETDSEADIYLGEEDYYSRGGRRASEGRDCEYEGDWEEEEEEKSERDSSSSAGFFRALQVHFPVLRKGLPPPTKACRSWGSEPELEYLRDGVTTVGSSGHAPSPEPRDHPPSCLSNSDESHIEVTDKDSDWWSDDLSSGVFSSYNSQTDGHMDWLLSTNRSPSYFFEGVDIWIENMNGDCLRIRERRRVRVGHVAMGISEQISTKAFSMETLDRKVVPFQQEVQESGLWLRCVPAPDTSPHWSWRIKDGKLEIRERMNE